MKDMLRQLSPMCLQQLYQSDLTIAQSSFCPHAFICPNITVGVLDEADKVSDVWIPRLIVKCFIIHGEYTGCPVLDRL